MKHQKRFYRLICLLLLFAFLINIAACSEHNNESFTNTTSLYRTTEKPSDIKIPEPIDTALTINFSQNDKSLPITDFALKLFKECRTDEGNTLISPLSVLFALAITANGAEGETLEEIETVLGADRTELSSFLSDYMKNLASEEKYKLSIANSVWIKDDEKFTVKEDFLDKCTEYFNTDIFKAAFDESTLNDINSWVYHNTDKMIPEILDRIHENAVMYLLNALAFDAEWENTYKSRDMEFAKFTAEDGSDSDLEFMYCFENVYLEDNNACGFVKYYNGRKYAFAALLPNEGISISDYILSLDAKKVSSILKSANNVSVRTSIPVFETEYTAEMSDVLSKMGIKTAFDAQNADFSSIGSYNDGNLFINRVIHKTFLSVNSLGTKAGAATSVEVTYKASLDHDIPSEYKEVYLDRPFVYMLIDCETNAPFFIGSFENPNK